MENGVTFSKAINSRDQNETIQNPVFKVNFWGWGLETHTGGSFMEWFVENIDSFIAIQSVLFSCHYRNVSNSV